MLRLLGRYLRPYWGQVVILTVFQILQAFLNLYLPNLQAAVIDEGVAKGNMSAIYSTGIGMLVISFFQVIAAVAALWLASRISARLAYELRRDFFGAVETFSLAELDRFSAGSLITRTTNDVQQVQQTFMQSTLFVLQAPVMLIGGLVMAIRQDAPLSLSFLVIIPIILVVAGAVLGSLGPLFGTLQKKLDDLNRVIREQVTGVRVIRAFTREETETKRFGTVNKATDRVLMRVGVLISCAIPVMWFIVNMASLAIMWFGGRRVEQGAMQIGSLQAFIQYLMIMLMGLMQAAMMSVMIPRAAVSGRRIKAVIDTKPDIAAPQTPYTPQGGHISGKIEFRDVSFAYPGAQEPVLSHISFTARPGQTTAFIGSTGSGKSSILRLATRMYDVTGGQVLVDGHDIRDYDPQALLRNYGMVPQTAVLFSGTLRDNMRYGKDDATDEEIWKALTIAQAADFVRDIPEGLDAHVAEGGTNFSGGQKQRLAMARAILRDPRVYTFDDSFSALDMATDRRLREALRPVTRRSTVLLVAQRASSIRDAEQIIVLDDGRISGIGTHEQLMATNTVYQQIVRSQGGDHAGEIPQGRDQAGQDAAADSRPTSGKEAR
jgi:ATP-binding cassette subfamily B multidrug efflux pump